MKQTLLTLALLAISSLLFAENIVFKADSMSGKAGSKTDATVLKGSAFVQTETMEISADSIELNGENFRYIVATGSVSGKITESQMEFSCGKVRYDRTTKIARLEDSVHLVDTKNDVSADAQLIEYNQNTEIAVMQISVKLIQKNNTCTSAYAIYRKNDQMLEMSGNPKIVQGEDTFRAQEITLNLDSQEITLDGRVSGTVTDTKKSESKSESPEGANEAPAPEGIKNGENEDQSPASGPDGAPLSPEKSEAGAGNTAADKTEESQ